MNALFPRFIKKAYRKEPISSFIVTVGVVDALIGGFDQSTSLLSFGIIMTLVAIALRFLQGQKSQTITAEETARLYLPPSSSQTPLPVLHSRKQHQR